jgi:membrane fusion protein
MSLFRAEAVEEKRRKLWGDVRIAHPPSLALWTAVISAVCVALIVVLAVGRYTRQETVSGFLEAGSGVVEVRPLQEGRVSRVLVRQGAHVKAGDPLIEFVSDVEALQGGPALDAQLAETNRQLDALERRRRAAAAGYSSENQRLRQQIGSQRELLLNLAGQRRDQLAAVELARADLQRLEQLQSRGFAPGSEVDRRRRTVLAEDTVLRQINSERAATDARIADMSSRIDASPAREAETEAVLSAEVARISQQRTQLAVARGYIVRAPVSGVITRMLVTDGMTPANNGALLTISPEGSMMFARVLVPTRAIGFLEVGQPANLKIDAFPYQRFGMLKGYVSDIYPMVIRPGEMAFPIEQKGPAYQVDIFITREFVNAYGNRRELRPGMVLQADLPIDRRKLWQQLFDPLLAPGRRAPN